MNVKSYYPVFLDLEHRRCLVVGGGAVAERKVQGLLDATSDVVVVGPSLTDALRWLATAGAIHHLPRTLGDADVEGCALVIAATDRAEVNAQVAAAAHRRGVWVKVVDTPAACDFIAPSVVRRGELQIAISTGAIAPLWSNGYGTRWSSSSGRNMAHWSMSWVASAQPCATGGRLLRYAKRRSNACWKRPACHWPPPRPYPTSMAAADITPNADLEEYGRKMFEWRRTQSEHRRSPHGIAQCGRRSGTS